ncbi:MAG: helix-turn-helix domain-containing protein [Solirubrobacteraceae bacterium]
MSGTAEAGKRERTKQANRAAILHAARDAFVELGYGATTVRDIVRRTALASGTFYNYFPDKEAVFRALVDETARAAAERTHHARRSATTLEEFLGLGFRVYFELLLADRATFELVRRNAGTVRAMFDEPAIGAGVDLLADDLRAAIGSGLLPDHDARMMASAMAGATFELAVRMLEDDAPDVERAVGFCTRLFAGGLARLG